MGSFQHFHGGVSGPTGSRGAVAVACCRYDGTARRYRLVLDVTLADLRNTPGGGDRAADTEAMVLESFNSGLRKLGLQLERRQGRVEMIIVDHVESVPTEN